MSLRHDKRQDFVYSFLMSLYLYLSDMTLQKVVLNTNVSSVVHETPFCSGVTCHRDMTSVKNFPCSFLISLYWVSCALNC